MKYREDLPKEKCWPDRKCTLLDPNAFPEAYLDYSDFACETDISNSISKLIGHSCTVKAKMKKIYTGSYLYEKPKMEPDTIVQVDEKHLNRICKKNGDPCCNCYSFPCKESVRNMLCNSITVQYEVENTAPSSCPRCGSKIVPENKSSTTLYDIRLQGKLGRAKFEYTRYRCSNKNCKKRIPAYQLPKDIQYVDENRNSHFTTRLQYAVEEAFLKNKSPKRISQGYGFSWKLALQIACKKAKVIESRNDAIENEKIRLQCLGIAPTKIYKKKKITDGYYTTEYYTETLNLFSCSLHAVFSLAPQDEMRLSYFIQQYDWNWLDHLVQCDFSVEMPKYSISKLNVLIYNYGRCKYPHVDHTLSYLLLRLTLSFALTYKRGKILNYQAVKELKELLEYYDNPQIPYFIEEHFKTILLLADSPLIKIEVKKALRYIRKIQMWRTDSTVAKSRRNPQTDRLSKLAIKAIETASEKCVGNSDYIISRLLYLNSAVIPFTYSYSKNEYISPLGSNAEFFWPDFEDYEYTGIPIHCLMHLLKSGLLNDVDCPKIYCSTDRSSNFPNHPCGTMKCPYIIYDE